MSLCSGIALNREESVFWVQSCHSEVGVFWALLQNRLPYGRVQGLLVVAFFLNMPLITTQGASLSSTNHLLCCCFMCLWLQGGVRLLRGVLTARRFSSLDSDLIGRSKKVSHMLKKMKAPKAKKGSQIYFLNEVFKVVKLLTS